MNQNRKLKDRKAQPHMPKGLATKPRSCIKGRVHKGTRGGQRTRGGAAW